MHFLGSVFPRWLKSLAMAAGYLTCLQRQRRQAEKSTVQQGHGWSAVDDGDLWPAHRRKQTAARSQTPEPFTRGLLWMPHSVLASPLQRPLRTEPSVIGRPVHGMQPTDV